ncbi:hypothetical protein DFH06DRAFT_1089172 [Mycena polygramma]|nr:hypothetical protein DFH06DRAFT_1089172 [Mycena polygramma]
MSDEQLLVKYDLEKLKWQDVGTVDGSRCFARPLAGSELVQEVWNRFEKGNQTMFLAVYLDLASPQSESDIVAAARAAWISLRHQIPIIATAIEVEGDVPMLKYRVPNSDQVKEWANRTLEVHHRPALDLNHLREELGWRVVPSVQGDQTWMHLIHTSLNDSTPVSRIGFIFRTHHAITDGNGSKIITDRFLTEFGTRLATREKAPILEWGSEVDNLTPAMFLVLKSSEALPIPTNSPEKPDPNKHPVYRTLANEMKAIFESTQNQYGFKPRDADPGWVGARRAELVLSRKESDALLAYVKKEPYTLTELAHAALAMVVMLENSPSKDAANCSLNNYCMFDGRSRCLRAPHAGKGYPGYALLPPMLRVPVSLFMTAEGTPLALDRDLLVKVAGEIRNAYAAHRERSSAYFAPGCDLLVQLMKEGYANGFIATNQCYMFSSDGRGETYLSPTFADAKGNTVFTLNKFFCSINHPHPAPYFRMSSWHGIVELGADFNGHLLSEEDTSRYLREWKEFLFLVME